MNLFIFNGNITKDIDLRTTTGGKQVASFSVALNNGKDDTTFINCVAWEKTAELLNSYCKKGDRLCGQGRIVNRSYDKDGVKVYVTEILVDRIDFPPKRNDAQPDAPMTGNMPSAIEDDLASEIPF
jgi:single-strand DNA-binding protein